MQHLRLCVLLLFLLSVIMSHTHAITHCSDAHESACAPVITISELSLGIPVNGIKDDVILKLVNLAHKNQKKTFACNICDKSFTTKRSLNRHCQHNHVGKREGEKLFECKNCHKQFTRKNSLENHVHDHHAHRTTLIKCPLCHRKFSKKSNLEEHHLRIHVQGRPFPCEVCNQQFKNSNDLTNHLRNHTNERPFICALCKRSFTQNAYLSIHMKTHDSRHFLKCDHCDMKFKNYLGLKKHQYTHTM